MRNLGDSLIALGLVFAPLSLLSFGGGNAVIADIAHQAIAVQGWTSEREFADLFALSRAAPGPGSMLAALIGWKAAGIPGALVATLAFYLPSAALVLVVVRLWGRWRGSRWHTAIERGMAPIAAGPFLAAGLVLLQASPGGPAGWDAAIVATRPLLGRPRLHPGPLLRCRAAPFRYP